MSLVNQATGAPGRWSEGRRSGEGALSPSSPAMALTTGDTFLRQRELSVCLYQFFPMSFQARWQFSCHHTCLHLCRLTLC